MNILDRYERAHKRMAESGVPIRPELLREYLDVIRAIPRVRGGHMHARKLVITRNAPGGDFAKDIMRLAVEESWEIEAR